MSTQHYDLIIIGTGAGGGTLAYRLASSGKRILVLERGQFLPQEKANWSAVEVFQKNRYATSELWEDHQGKTFSPGTHYWVGGNTKVYGGALFRLRERDFEAVQHCDGVSPAWPLQYADFKPYYDQAEQLYQVHGQRGLDPTEPSEAADYPFPPVSHEPRIQGIYDALKAKQLNPFYLPLAVKLNEANSLLSACIRCNTCDGFPCLIHAKSDADINCVRPAQTQANLTLLTEAKVTQLVTSDSGREITQVKAEVQGSPETFSADIVVVACGAINSAALLLRSANDAHPNGLANRSDQVGRNFMKHQNGAIVGITLKSNPSIFQKTIGLNDFYWGEPGFDYPMGHIQLLGKVNGEMLAMDVPRFIPKRILDAMAGRSVDWWITAEDLPESRNRVRLKGDRIVLDYTDNNVEAFDRLRSRWISVLRKINGEGRVPQSVYFSKRLPVQGVAHQVGTCRFGTDPDSSVLDLNCRTHDVDNLYVVDGSFFPSSAAVNPSLTIMANALRVGDHLLQRLG
ncbi:GMC family oxidoreductase [Romeria aff. gracilis LEGE 07310]|uniref:GMC family oxidoreductase n=1 Tax=Vasconcelosia minhoensis LEGE 07310 TaxID=915328 RepID=A0A8J7DC86_9CYAN|nr:GMC family oxidoreductase [Romeria gracilis]MBE9078637.1 GMC family oxidoreductase [Romeria aff. gracilis LEGE 07310]